MGVVTIAIASAYIGDLRGPMATIVLTTPIAIGYFLSMRESWPWVLAAVAVLIGSALHIDEPDIVLRTVVLLIVMISGWLMLQTTKHRLVAALARHRQLSETDPLTGSANVRRLQTTLAEEVARSNRGGPGFRACLNNICTA